MVKIFLTYSYEDTSSANFLKAQLLRNNSLSIKFTNDTMLMAKSIEEQIDNCISESSVILSLISNNFNNNQLYELNKAVALGKPIFGVLISEIKENKILDHYKQLNIPIYDWTYQKLISLIYGEVNSIDYELKDEKILHSPQIKIDFEEISYQLTDHLIKHPEDIHQFDPRKYEEFIAFLLEKMNYKITLTQQSRDKGVDIYALRKDELGDFLTIVDCKKYSSSHPIGIGIVRNLYGTLNIEKASHGIIATTSSFTKGAREFEEHYKYQISLKDHSQIQSWIELVNKSKRI